MTAFRRSAGQTMVTLVKSDSTGDGLRAVEEWYLTVRCTNAGCLRLIAFQKAVCQGNESNRRLAITGEPSVDCPYCRTRVHFSVDQIERRKVMLSQL